MCICAGGSAILGSQKYTKYEPNRHQPYQRSYDRYLKKMNTSLSIFRSSCIFQAFESNTIIRLLGIEVAVGNPFQYDSRHDGQQSH